MKNVKTILLLSICLLLSIFTSCDNTNTTPYGVLNINFNRSKTIQPNLEISKYKITGKLNSDHSVTYTNDDYKANTPISLALGMWTFNLTGYNNADKAVTKTKAFSVEITLATATTVNINLEYFTEGVGSFDITIKWPSGCPTLHHINWSINSASAVVKSGTISTFTATDTSKTISDANIPQGDYTFTADVYESETNKLFFSIKEKVHIYAGLTSTKTFELPLNLLILKVPEITAIVNKTKTMSGTWDDQKTDITIAIDNSFDNVNYYYKVYCQNGTATPDVTVEATQLSLTGNTATIPRKGTKVEVLAKKDGCFTSKATREMVYEIGDIGPAGGTIFYNCDADNDATNNGKGPDNLSSNSNAQQTLTWKNPANVDQSLTLETSLPSWKYIEYANGYVQNNYKSVAWNFSILFKPVFGQYKPDGTTEELFGLYTTEDLKIGKGRINTTILAMKMEGKVFNGTTALTNFAAKKIINDFELTINGKTYNDWFIPSVNEGLKIWKVAITIPSSDIAKANATNIEIEFMTSNDSNYIYNNVSSNTQTFYFTCFRFNTPGEPIPTVSNKAGGRAVIPIRYF